MRRISFAMTTEAVIARRKTVTRRLGWYFLKPGDRLLAVDKLRTKNARKLGVIEVISIRPEPLNAITDDDVIREGGPFPQRFYGGIDIPRKRFVEGFCQEMRVFPNTEVNRIEFRYVDEEVE